MRRTAWFHVGFGHEIGVWVQSFQSLGVPCDSPCKYALACTFLGYIGGNLLMADSIYDLPKRFARVFDRQTGMPRRISVLDSP